MVIVAGSGKELHQDCHLIPVERAAPIRVHLVENSPSFRLLSLQFRLGRIQFLLLSP